MLCIQYPVTLCIHWGVPTSEVFLSFFFRYRFRGTVDVFIYILQFFCSAVSRTTIMYMYNSARTYTFYMRDVAAIYAPSRLFTYTSRGYVHTHVPYIIKAHKIKKTFQNVYGRIFPPPFAVSCE